MKIKVLIIVEALGGGVRRHILDLIYGLDQEKFDIFLLYSKNRADDIFFKQQDNLKNYATLIESKYMIQKLSLINDIKAYKDIRDVIKRINPDIVHCHSSKAGALGRIAAKRLKIKKIIYTPHAYYFQNPNLSKNKKNIYIFIERILSRYFTTKTINVSNGEKQCAIDNKIDKINKFVTIYNGIEDIELPKKETARELLSIPKDAFVIGVTARLNEQKDPFTFVKIAKNVVSKYPNSHFIYIGDGPLFNEISNYIKKNDLENNIHLIGFRNDADKIIVAFDLYLLTSLYEGMPYSLVEAMRAGLPIIATNVIGNNEIVFPNINGELFEAKNISEGTKLVNSIIEDNKYDNYNIKTFYKENFTLEKMIKSIENEYIN